MKTSSIRTFTLSVPNGFTQYNNLRNFALNSNLVLISEFNNVLVKKIHVYPTIITSVTDNSIKFYQCRIRILARDGRIITEYGGNILNGLSGDWNGSIPKKTDYDIVLSTKKNSIDFPQGVLIGGFQLISESLILNNPSNNLGFSFNINMYHD
jgi:hypothetical protein